MENKEMSEEQQKYIELLKTTSSRVGIEVDEDHFDTNMEYYWNQRGQLQTVIQKNIGDEKLKMIFQNHIQKLSKENVLEFAPMKIVKTQKFSVYAWA